MGLGVRWPMLVMAFTFGSLPVVSLGGGPVAQEWVRTRNSQFFGVDEGTAVSIDPFGNVIVTAAFESVVYPNRDITTIKYNTDGEELWTRRVQDLDGIGFPKAVATDNLGNVVVAAMVGISGKNDYLTLKYDPNGNLLWQRRYSGPGEFGDYLEAMVIDPEGNVVVTGTSRTAGFPSTSSDFLTLKYDLNGNLLWDRRYSGPGDNADSATAVGIDPIGNVWVTGHSYRGADSETDILTLKYSPEGSLLWERSFNGNASLADSAFGIAVDGAGNSVVTGITSDLNGVGNIIVLRYGPEGQVVWTRDWDGVSHLEDSGRKVKMDKRGNVVVLGWTDHEAAYNRDFVTIKLRSDGTIQWERTYDGSGHDQDRPYDLVVDADDSIVITGVTTGVDTGQDSLTVKYDPAGNLVWDWIFAGAGRMSDETFALAMDDNGAVFLTGWTGRYADGSDVLTIKLADLEVLTRLGIRPSDGFVGKKAVITAFLRNKDTLEPIVGKEITFLFDNEIVIDSVLTNDSGVARCFYPIAEGVPVGIHSLTARFEGELGYRASERTVNLTIAPGPSKIFVFEKKGTAGRPVVLAARLANGMGTPLPGRTLRILVAGQVVATCTTNALGVGSLWYDVPNGTNTGTYEVRAEFDGDESHQPTNGAGTLTIG